MTRAEERTRVCEALIDLSVDLRFVNTTLEMVLERAGVDERAFRRHFTDLEDCFAKTLEPLAGRFFERVFEAFAAEDGWRNQMRSAAHEMLAFFAEDFRRARFMNVEVLFAGQSALLIRDEAMQGLFLLIDQGRLEMEDPDSLTPFTAEAIGCAIYQRIQSAIEHGDIDAFEPGVPEMLYTAFLPYLGQEVAQEELQIPPPSVSVQGA
jgi:AcrR family transcriptional regulator